MLRDIRRRLDPFGKRSEINVFLDPEKFKEANHGLLLWEAFVSGQGKPTTGESREARAKDPRNHVRDAEYAVQEFERRWQNDKLCPVTTEPVFSLVGAGLLRSGWSDDASLLERACVIVRTGKDPCPCEKKAAGE